MGDDSAFVRSQVQIYDELKAKDLGEEINKTRQSHEAASAVCLRLRRSFHAIIIVLNDDHLFRILRRFKMNFHLIRG